MIRTVAHRGAWLLLRGAWLMLGAAIAMAAAILTGGTISLLPENGRLTATSLTASSIGVIVVAVVLGLLPGVREIEVTAARTLLGVNLEPTPTPALRHRWRTSAWTLLHAVTGLVTGFCLLGLVPGAVLSWLWIATGRTELLERTGSAALAVHPVMGATIMTVLMVAGPWLSGWVALRMAPVLLGPSAADRLAVAEARLADERRHTALARELHDGIGHALAIISIQAAAARRVHDHQPDQAKGALQIIEQTSAQAQAELDHLLGLLRDPATPARRTTRDDLPTLVDRHRRAGLQVTVTDDHRDVPALVWAAVLDILAEALTNAHRHAPDSPVEVRISQDDTHLRLTVDNPAPQQGAHDRTTGGRGILGMQERAALVDGTVSTSCRDHQWQVVATIPVGPDPVSHGPVSHKPVSHSPAHADPSPQEQP